jgi:hypothetical protein
VVVDVVVEPLAASVAPEAAGFSLVVPSELAGADAAPSLGAAAAPLVEAARERLASRASFLAQPDPLNTMAGVDRARFIDPPHRSQAAGPGADIPWITSTT